MVPNVGHFARLYPELGHGACWLGTSTCSMMQSQGSKSPLQSKVGVEPDLKGPG